MPRREFNFGLFDHTRLVLEAIERAINAEQRETDPNLLPHRSSGEEIAEEFGVEEGDLDSLDDVSDDYKPDLSRVLASFKKADAKYNEFNHYTLSDIACPDENTAYAVAYFLQKLFTTVYAEEVEETEGHFKDFSINVEFGFDGDPDVITFRVHKKHTIDMRDVFARLEFMNSQIRVAASTVVKGRPYVFSGSFYKKEQGLFVALVDSLNELNGEQETTEAKNFPYQSAVLDDKKGEARIVFGRDFYDHIMASESFDPYKRHPTIVAVEDAIAELPKFDPFDEDPSGNAPPMQ